MKKTIVLLTLLTSINIAGAVENGFYIGLNGNLSIGPASVSAAPDAFSSGTYNSNQTFTYANDGRFQYDGGLGYTLNNFGVELRYFSLGSQHQISQNGAPLTTNQTGTYDGKYFGINGKYFVPLNSDRHELHLSLGGGQLSTSLSAPNANASQNEMALMLGVGLRYNINRNLGLNIETNRITPVTHGMLGSGLYNDAYTVISLGFFLNY